MFKKENFEQEIMQSMKNNLIANKLEKQHSFERIGKAVDFIQAAADIFDDTGFYSEAEVLTSIIEK